MRKSGNTRGHASLKADRYLEMIQSFPLRPIRTRAELNEATTILDKWFGRPDMDQGEQDYVEVLATLVADFEEKTNPVHDDAATPLDVLKELLEQHDMHTADLGKLIGSKGLASEILNGKRPLSRAQVFKVSDHFGVEPGLLLERPRE